MRVTSTMGVGLHRAADISVSGSGEAPLRSEVVQVCPREHEPPADAERTATRLTELLRLHYSAVWRTLRRLGVAEQVVDDAAQEVFIVLARKLGRVQPGSERNYLLNSALRIAANYRRSSRARHEVVDEQALSEQRDPLPTAEQLLDQKRLRQAFDELVESWPLEIRTSFVLFELEGLSVPEISELTETKPGTVASRLRRARELFQAGVKRMKARRAAGGAP